MQWHQKKTVLLGYLLSSLAVPALGQSFYPSRLDDPQAIYLTPDKFPVHADGQGDDTAALQAAIDKVRSDHGEGVLFIPQGRYRISRTIYVWPGVRLIGFGPNRPVFALGDNTPGYQGGLGYMVVFAGGSPHTPRKDALEGTVPPNNTIPDANPGTFYSAMSNIDFELGRGNPGAVAIRFHIAQHCFLTHMDFHIDSGLAALKDVGNEAEDLHFFGGKYGIVTEKPSPGWQFTLLDSSFEGQSVAAIAEHEAGLTLVHDSFRSVPQAVSIDPGYPDELWVRDSTFDNISGPLVTISNERSPRTEINMRNLLCRQVPTFAKFRESGKQVSGRTDNYRVRSFSHGLALPEPGHEGAIRTDFDFNAEPLTALPNPAVKAIPALPPENTWVNLKTLGVKGDGVTDDTAAIRKAIAEHSAIYVPSGRYIVTGTITLKPETALIGLDPSTTRFDLPDGTPDFQGPGAPQPLVESSRGGSAMVSGIGLYTNGINSRAVGLLWRAGPGSLVDDVRFLGGHGTNGPDGGRVNPYNNTHTADPDLHRRWDAQYPSLWVTDGGGGTFADIWTPDTYAQAGLYISNTTTPGYVYELSSEHHVRNEVKIVNASHWELDAVQTEEERGESAFALPLSIDRSSDITVANLHSYRVVSSYQPYPTAIAVHDSEDIRFRNVHVDSDSKAAFDNTLVDEPSGAEVREHEFASLTVKGSKPEAALPDLPHTVAPGAALEKLASGFFNASGAAADATGNLYFVDARRQQILRWNAATRDLAVVRDSPLDPVNLAIDKAGDVLVTSYSGNGTVYAFRPDAPLDEVTLLKPEPARPRPGATPWLPADYWVNGAFDLGTVPRNQWQFLSPDGSMFIAADQDFVDGALYYGTKMAPVLRAFSLTPAQPGRPFYLTDESQERTYRTAVDASGALGKLELFAERGGESVVQDGDGTVYLAAGQVYAYSPSGALLGTIAVPERPIDLLFGGPDGRTLFVFTHTALYAIRMSTRN
jgi:sugar lactone lactonase YvrE